jgi:mannose-6-phosphate isomerase-like protein (cupin superfamily)
MDKKIEFKATGETITFTKSTAEVVEMFVTLPVSAEGTPSHRHVLQSESFEIIEGKLGLDCGDQKIVLEPGKSFTVPPNTLHRFYPVEGTVLKFKAIVKPALSIEYLLTGFIEAANRKNSKVPSMFDACYIMRQVKGEYYLGGIPQFVQQTFFPMMAMFGKLFGLLKAKPKSA